MAISSLKYCQKELHKGAQTHLRQITIVEVQRIALHCMHVQFCPALCNPMDCSSPVSSVHGIFQARILEWVAISYSRESSRPMDWTCLSCIGRQILYHWTTWEAPVHHIQSPYTVQIYCSQPRGPSVLGLPFLPWWPLWHFGLSLDRLLSQGIMGQEVEGGR